MKIKMLTTKCGPVSSENWNEGQVRNVCVEEARYRIEVEHTAKALEPYPTDVEKTVVAPAEKATITAPERAVIKPTETAKVVVAPEPIKAPVAPPAVPAGKSNSVASAKAATWGTSGVK